MIRDIVVRDAIDDIYKLSAKQLLSPARIKRYRRFDDARVRATYAVRWAKAKYPDDPVNEHREEAAKLFRKKLT